MNDVDEARNAVFGLGDALLLFAGGLGVVIALSPVGRGLDGPSYLVVFACIWALLTLVHIGLRRLWRDNFIVSGTAAVVLAGVALSRYSWGVDQGMRRWGFLLIMTFIGCLSFFIRASQLADGDRGQGGDSSTWWSSSCGGSSDSGGGGGCGGGCGGGGCGGCGGS
jgi:hypothetical protein